MELGIKGKRALITGGATGIGRAIALDLAREGVSVVVTSRKQENIDAILLELNEIGSGHHGVVCPLTEEGKPEELAQYIWDNAGPVDIVVNNIGDTLGILDPYCSNSDWQRLYRLILEVAVEINNLFIPHMKKQGWGRIVNITAGASMENSGPVPYCSMKAAFTAYTRSMGRILAIETDDVVMSAVLPGVILTEQGHWQNVLKENPAHAEKYLKERCPLGRFGKPEEISGMVVFLCSKRATFCQGSIVPVDAGQAKHYFHINGVAN